MDQSNNITRFVLEDISKVLRTTSGLILKWFIFIHLRAFETIEVY